MVTQLRIFTIHPGRMDEWLSRWKGAVVPLRRAFGFTVEGAWVNREANQFVWLLRLSDSEDWASRDRAYYDSAERRSLRPDPARCIAQVEAMFLEPLTAD